MLARIIMTDSETGPETIFSGSLPDARRYMAREVLGVNREDRRKLADIRFLPPGLWPGLLKCYKFDCGGGGWTVFRLQVRG